MYNKSGMALYNHFSHHIHPPKSTPNDKHNIIDLPLKPNDALLGDCSQMWGEITFFKAIHRLHCVYLKWNVREAKIKCGKIPSEKEEQQPAAQKHKK